MTKYKNTTEIPIFFDERICREKETKQIDNLYDNWTQLWCSIGVVIAKELSKARK